MHRAAAVLSLAAVLGLLAAGCGSGSTSTTSTPTPTAPPSGSTTSQGSGSTPSGGQSATTTPSTGGGSSPSSSSSSASGDNSIQTYGSAAASAQKIELKNAAFSFFKAMADSDYAKLCEGISAANRKGLEAFTKAKHEGAGCPKILKMLIARRGVPEARKAAQGTLTSVRIKGDTAFVLFRPRGGPPSYFVMKREAGAWKAISLAPGTPLNPLAGR
jgi:hypothetical protein